ncbi:hypothetical protein FACS1894191_6350 [Clostridia bacterium]|nr:hypothetical protein FACS1894191_6350 [Clostridia bacterium]
MLEYKEIALSDREWMEPLFKLSNHRSEEYSFTFSYIWRKVFGYTAARMEDFLIIRGSKGDNPPRYLFPAGKGDISKVLETLAEEARQEGHGLVFNEILAEHKSFLEENYPGQYYIEPVEHYFDYIYDTQSLITLAGKKLHSKRNHINRFKELYPDWSYEPITADNLDEVLHMNDEWLKVNMEESSSKTLIEESKSVSAAICDFLDLKLDGGLIRAGGRIIAFSMGDRLNTDTYLVHIEKAFGDVQGAYTIINQEFSRHNCQSFTYINREDDSGDEGLRKAKKSYNPAFMVEKFNAKLLTGSKW